jgi:hypothetical protein
MRWTLLRSLPWPTDPPHNLGNRRHALGRAHPFFGSVVEELVLPHR